MCTVTVYRSDRTCFGRNMDIDVSFGEQVVNVPKGHVFQLKNGSSFTSRYAVTGMASVVKDVPLFADGFNEKGVAGAGLNFPGSAYYGEAVQDRENLAPYELLWKVLSSAADLKEVRKILENVNLTAVPFMEGLPLSPMHFIFADGSNSIVYEPMKDGGHIYEDPYDVLTNNPPFPYHAYSMSLYRGMKACDQESDYPYELPVYAAGMGGYGLPGDASSPSRFVRAAFTLSHSLKKEGKASIIQTFHILDAVKMVEGTVRTPSGTYDRTTYQACMDLKEKIYYYRTYDEDEMHSVRMQTEGDMRVFPLTDKHE